MQRLFRSAKTVRCHLGHIAPQTPSSIRHFAKKATSNPDKETFPSIPLKSAADIEAFLSQPSWDISDLLGSSAESKDAADDEPKQQVSTAEIQHLLRLSALRAELTDEELAKQRETLEAQLNFVKAVQSVDTEGVEPLVAIRDETENAEKENEITLDELRSVLDKEEQVGRYRRIVAKNPDTLADEADKRADREQKSSWDPLALAPSKVGRYIKVNTKER